MIFVWCLHLSLLDLLPRTILVEVLNHLRLSSTTTPIPFLGSGLANTAKMHPSRHRRTSRKRSRRSFSPHHSLQTLTSPGLRHGRNRPVQHPYVLPPSKLPCLTRSSNGPRPPRLHGRPRRRARKSLCHPRAVLAQEAGRADRRADRRPPRARAPAPARGAHDALRRWARGAARPAARAADAAGRGRRGGDGDVSMAGAEDDGGREEGEEEYYTEGSRELLEARREIARYSSSPGRSAGSRSSGRRARSRCARTSRSSARRSRSCLGGFDLLGSQIASEESARGPAAVAGREHGRRGVVGRQREVDDAAEHREEDGSAGPQRHRQRYRMAAGGDAARLDGVSRAR